MKIKPLLICLLAIVYSFQSFSQAPKKYHSGEVRQMLEKLNVLGTVLYVAAHPDDENTRLIAYYANHEHMRTAYLSATRGDGGQNLVGPEIREELGLIRTQELLAARRTDGGQQFFSRANDFGYSKHPDETFNIWNRDEVLADFVWVIRKFKPDVIITRFNQEPGTNHGHHTASAILAEEAFKLSGDKNAYPEQLNFVDTWQPSKIFWNTGWWWFRNNPEKDTSKLTTINVGTYSPLLGKSDTEIAAESRSMHKSQGFGSSGARGEEIEYLEQWGGNQTEKPFDDITTSWGRVKGSESVQFYITKAIKEYNETNPSLIMESLVLARKELKKLDNDFWVDIKTKELDELIKAVSGLFIELKANDNSYAVGDSITINLEAINRSNSEIALESIQFNQWVNPVEIGTSLLNNKRFTSEMNFVLPNGIQYSNPYWLMDKGSLGMYKVEDQTLRGTPENDPSISALAMINVGGEKILLTIPVIYKRTDPVDGEVYEPVSVGPPVMVNMSGGVLVFGDDQPKSIDVRVIAGMDNVKGVVKLEMPSGWSSIPSSRDFEISNKGEEQLFSFQVTPPKKASEGKISAVATINGTQFKKGLSVIEYDHIPKQTLYPDAEIRIVRLDLKKKGNLIGYIDGAGDAIPQNLKEVGYQVEYLQKDDVIAESLAKYDAIILGVRAFNTVDWLSFKNVELFKYAENGGTLIIQYNTNHRLVTQDIAPYDLKLSRDRVAVEDAPIRILDKNHPILQGPNKITDKDFENWVQERGLYFPNEWSDDFAAILSSNDPEESPKDGGLLVAKYGKGYYIYSGYSWFRELPAGVPGAYRLFVNMISIGK
jgi:LmbE family N-acetylglucosaminyl deacetylase